MYAVVKKGKKLCLHQVYPENEAISKALLFNHLQDMFFYEQFCNMNTYRIQTLLAALIAKEEEGALRNNKKYKTVSRSGVKSIFKLKIL